MVGKATGGVLVAVLALGLAPAALAETPGDAGFIVSGSRTAKGAGIVRIRADLDNNGTYETARGGFNPYPGAKIVDGVRVAVGDFDGDGNESIVTSAGNGLPVKIFELNADGSIGLLLDSRKVYGKHGAFVAAGDVNGDGRDELIVAAGSGMAPTVRIYSDVDGDGKLFDFRSDSFSAFSAGFRGGVTVAAADVDSFNGDEIVTGTATRGRRVKIWNDIDHDLAVSDNPVEDDFLAYNGAATGGVNVAAGQVSGVGSGGAEVFVAPAAGKRPVQIRTDVDGDGEVSDDPPFESFWPYGTGWGKGVRIGVGDTDHTGFYVELMTAPATSVGGKKTRIYDDDGDAGLFLHDNPVTQSFRSMPTSVKAGVYVALGRFNAAAYAATGLPAGIIDAGTIVSSLTVPASAGRIRVLSVALNITHTFDADLDVSLTHVPSGRTIDLFTDVGGGSDGFLVYLTDAGGTDIGAVVPAPGAPVEGILKPEAPATLATFNGLDASGTWRLTVTDDAALFSGLLMSWSLVVAY